jgi:transcriptional regulator with GAF, ATPase, and Fis domain
MAQVTTEILESGAALRVPSLELVVADGPDRGARCQVTPAGIRVGTAPNCALKLTDPTVSRLHCEVKSGPGGTVHVTDLGSTNGTFIDSVPIHDAELVPGARLKLGQSLIELSAGDGSYTLELSPRHSFGDVIGQSVEMRRMYSVLEKVAPTTTTVLIQGETGVGKELVARAIHESSPRARKPFVVVDCGAIAETLIESELFGHVRGAFSGAVGDRRGLFEEADGGTLFLDEIGELPLSLQPKLLRALERLEVRRVGGNTSRTVDVRIVAATNRSLASSVNDGTFREDLYYRISVVEVLLPPLRTRRDDIPLLAEHFYRRYAGDREPLPSELVASVLHRAWPGNVRELRNFVERSVSLGIAAHRHGQEAAAGGSGSSPSQPPPPPAQGGAIVPVHLPLKDARAAFTEQFELLYVKALLDKTGGNVTRAAELAGVNRRSLQRLIASLGLRGGTDTIPPEPPDP